MTALQHHPSKWLRSDAAEAFNAAENDHGVLTVNSAGRLEAEQQGFIDRWNKGGANNRPPYLYKPAMPAPASNHVRNGGVAVDIKEFAKFAQYCEQYGFIHSFPTSDPVHFDFHGTNSAGHVNSNPTTKAQQEFLISRGFNLGPSGADGVPGPFYHQAVKDYETYLASRGWYSGKIDGIWGGGVQAGHTKFWAELNTPATAPASSTPNAPVASGHTATVNDLMSLSQIKGFQRIARLNGGATSFDNKSGPKTIKGMQTFLNVNYRGSVAAWLRAKWGYTDKDDIWGPNMSAAAQRANAANAALIK